MNIVVKDYTKEIGKAVVLDHISLEMHGGLVYGLKGKNGAGKTMLMRAICGLIRPTSGWVEIDGRRLGRDLPFPKSVGVLLENLGFAPDLSGMKNLRALADIRRKIGKEEIRRSMERVGLDPRDPKKYRRYSLGMKQKLGIAAAIMEEPDLILLDEPANALDEGSVQRLRDLLQDLKKAGRIILISCHDDEELYRLSDCVFILEGGKLKGQKIASDLSQTTSPTIPSV
jgi:ABC-2 type transport system ATP-binding protein